MKAVFFLMVMVFLVACTSTSEDSAQNAPEGVEPSTAMPVPGTETVETVVEPSDDYEDLNTADDSFDAIDETLRELE